MGLSGTRAQADDRLPSASERKEIISALRLVHEIWPGARSKQIIGTYSEKLANEELLIRSNASADGLTEFPDGGKNRVWIASKFFADPGFKPRRAARAFVPGSKQAAIELASAFEGRIRLAATLVHEWKHTTQSLWERSKWTGLVEGPAYSVEISFLRAVASKYARWNHVADEIESLISTDIETCDQMRAVCS